MRAGSRPLCWLLLSALLPMVLGPTADALLHLEGHGDDAHGAAYSLGGPAAADGGDHGECAAWKAESNEHAAHPGSQFEPLAGLHHGDHAALCPGCGHGPTAALSASGMQDRFAAQTARLPGFGSAPLDPRLRHARPRAPPSV